MSNSSSPHTKVHSEKLLYGYIITDAKSLQFKKDAGVIIL